MLPHAYHPQNEANAAADSRHKGQHHDAEEIELAGNGRSSAFGSEKKRARKIDGDDKSLRRLIHRPSVAQPSGSGCAMPR
jgi:hypothetical protein